MMGATPDQSVAITVTLKNEAGAPLELPFEMVVSGRENVLDGPTGTGKDGLAVVNFRSGVAETKTLTVTAAGVSLTPATLLVVPGPIQALRFSSQPTNVRVGEVIRPPVVITAADGRGNPITETDITVSVRLVRSTGGVVSNGQARRFTDGGVTFDALTIDRAQTGYALRAESSGGGAVESERFDVTP